MKKLTSRKHGFTLIELMIVMAIIAILAVLGIAAIQSARKTARDTQRRANAKSVQVALEAYQTAQKDYPSPLAAFANNVYGLTCRADCGGVGIAGPLNSYVSGDLKDANGSDLKSNSATATTFRYYYNRLTSQTYDLGIATETKVGTEPGALPTWNTTNYEQFNMQ